METTRNPSINFILCLVCQLQKEKEVVENPSSYETLLEAISVRARYGETKYVEIWVQLPWLKSKRGNMAPKVLSTSNPFWDGEKTKGEVGFKRESEF